MKDLFRHPMNFFWWLIRPLFLWVVSRISPENPREVLELNAEQPVLYVLPKRSLIDLLVLYHHCRKEGLPRPRVAIRDLKNGNHCSWIYLTKPGIFLSRFIFRPSRPLMQVVELLEKNPEQEIQLVPVSILWGKDPGKDESSLLKLFFTDDENAGMLQKFFIVMAHGRNNYVHFGKPVSMRRLVDEKAPTDQKARKLRRILRVHFRRQRSTILGHRLYFRENVIRRLVNSAPVQFAIKQELRRKRHSSRWLENRARKFAQEISADITYSVVTMFRILLSRLWNRVYDGVEIDNLEVVKDLADKDYEIVYVPNHRSHFDYLLINYTIYESGLPPPHTAAGINLNFWPVGGLLRRGGAFFLRRTFKGDRLYRAVFTEYLHFLLVQGYPVAFFPEGGRSRIGKLLQPKTGMLSMVLHSFLRDSMRPVALVPIYIGYDKVVELNSYFKELSGESKRKESFTQLLSARRILKSYLGKAYMGFGQPILLDHFLDKTHPDWRHETLNASRAPDFVTSVSRKLATEVQIRINNAAIVSPVSLFSLGLLSVPQRAMPEEELLTFVSQIITLQKELPHFPGIILPEGDPRDLLKAVERLGSVKRFRHVGGDVIYLNEMDGILMSYYRNSVLYLFALPSLVARYFTFHEEIPETRLTEGCTGMYPFLKEEFFLRWEEHEVAGVLGELVGVMISMGLLHRSDGLLRRPETGSPEFGVLQNLGQVLGLTIERYAIVTALLAKNAKKGYVYRKDFQTQCEKMAQRLAILSGVQNPVSDEKGLFSNHIRLLQGKGLVNMEEHDRLVVHPGIEALAEGSAVFLSPVVNHSISRITSVNVNT